MVCDKRSRFYRQGSYARKYDFDCSINHTLEDYSGEIMLTSIQSSRFRPMTLYKEEGVIDTDGQLRRVRDWLNYAGLPVITRFAPSPRVVSRVHVIVPDAAAPNGEWHFI